ncbi:MAG: PelD GGDEF domain-containing protein [Formivibrio sp.]|nr:PelD GGDEF domain-containing protein [Formivibrio sp.]
MKSPNNYLEGVSALPDLRSRPVWQWVEAVIIPAGALWVAWLIKPNDPFCLTQDFSWPWLAPLLVALRYGVLPGLLSGGILLAAWLQLVGATAFPPTYFLGGFILVMVSGEYGSLWRTRIRRVEELNYYLDDRLEQLARHHLLLRLSHERLEQGLISRPVTLRDALAHLSTLLKQSTNGTTLPAAQPFLEFLAQICQLEQATILEFKNGQVDSKPIAQIGKEGGYAVDDPLIIYAMEHKLLCHIQSEFLESGESNLLLALPLITSTGDIRAILTVRQMPFFALNDDTMQMLAALGAYYVEQIVVEEVAAPVLNAMPECPPEFAYEAFKLQRLQRETGITSAIVILTFKPSSLQHELLDLVQRQQRSQDMAWEIQQGSNHILVTLMPLCNLAAVKGYLARIDTILHARFGQDMEQANIEHSQIDLTSSGGLLSLKDILGRHRD